MAKISSAKFISPDGGSVNISQLGGGIVKAVNDSLQALALEVQKRAREYVPLELGYAEKAIKVDSQSQRRDWAVYLDTSEEVTHDGRTYPIGDYLMWLHEGSYNLGPASLAKEATLQHGFVGPKFLERAFRDVATPESLRQITTDLRNALAQRSAAAALRRMSK